MSKRETPPYVSAEVVAGRLVRVCPECRQAIGERTDEEGKVSNNFAEHWEAEHAERPPERQRYYLLVLQPRDDELPGPGPEALRDMSRLLLDRVRSQIEEVEWELVERLEDLPERAPALLAWEVLRGSWQIDGDDPQLHKIRWYRREGEHLVFTPTKAQLEEWDAAYQRAWNVRGAFLERHRDELPRFTGKSVEEWERFSEVLRRQEDEIAEDFDTASAGASRQFYRGDPHWQATLEAAISDLGITEQEVEEERIRREEARARANELLTS